MTGRLRELPRLVRAVFVYAVRSGRWWTPLVVAMVAVIIGAVTVATHVVPVTIYVLF